MTSRRISILTGAAGLIAGLTFAGQAAFAGHTNPVLHAELDGKEEVGKGDPNGRGEIYVFGVDEDTADTRQKLCYVLVADKIDPTAGGAAHIHEGQPGENGPVVARLAFPAGGDASDCFDEDSTRGGSPVFTDGFTPAELLANPGDYYVNVHTAEYPDGAIRGQLEAN